VTFINVINKARGSAIASTISVDSNGSPREARMLPTKVITKVSIYDQLRFLEPYWCIKITETLDAIPIVMPISELITKWRRGFSIVYANSKAIPTRNPMRWPNFLYMTHLIPQMLSLTSTTMD
jgi:hypothetical protein